MDPKSFANLDPKLKEAYDRIMGTSTQANSSTPQPANDSTPPVQNPLPQSTPTMASSMPQTNPVTDTIQTSPLQPDLQTQPVQDVIQSSVPVTDTNHMDSFSSASQPPMQQSTPPDPMTQPVSAPMDTPEMTTSSNDTQGGMTQNQTEPSIPSVPKLEPFPEVQVHNQSVSQPTNNFSQYIQPQQPPINPPVSNASPLPMMDATTQAPSMDSTIPAVAPAPIIGSQPVAPLTSETIATQSIPPASTDLNAHITQSMPKHLQQKTKIAPLLFVIVGVLFFGAYAVFWIKIFNISLPFPLPF